MSRYAVKRAIQFPRRKLREAKWFIQRGRRGWSDRDIWNLDDHLARVISGSVNHLASTAVSYPGEMHEDDWTYILTTKIALPLTQWARRWDDEYFLDEGQEAFAYLEAQEALKVMAQWFGHLWD